MSHLHVVPRQPGRLTDLLIVLALGLVSLFSVAMSSRFDPPIIQLVALLLSTMGMVAPLFWRRSKPIMAMWLVFGFGLLQAASSPVATPAVISVPIMSYSVARFVAGRKSRTVLVLGMIGSIAAALSWNRTFTTYQASSVTQTFVSMVLVTGVCMAVVTSLYGVGRRVRDNTINAENIERARNERLRFEMMQREQAARNAEMRTRNEIARELHDIVAHSLSVMIVQAEGGRALATKKPEAAAEVLGTLAETGREALTEMRRLVGVLRADPHRPQAEYAPASGLGDIAAMVERSGERVTFEQQGQIPAVPATLGLTVFRVAQEAVTNFLKHAGPNAHAIVRVRYSSFHVEIDVTDDGLGSAANNDGAGNGLRGMYERVASMGGTLRVGPLNGSGYRVYASIPLPRSVGRLGV